MNTRLFKQLIFGLVLSLTFPLLLFAPSRVHAADKLRVSNCYIGGARLENMLVVTKNGAEIMHYFPRDEIFVAPR